MYSCFPVTGMLICTVTEVGDRTAYCTQQSMKMCKNGILHEVVYSLLGPLKVNIPKSDGLFRHCHQKVKTAYLF